MFWGAKPDSTQFQWAADVGADTVASMSVLFCLLQTPCCSDNRCPAAARGFWGCLFLGLMLSLTVEVRRHPTYRACRQPTLGLTHRLADTRVIANVARVVHTEQHHPAIAVPTTQNLLGDFSPPAPASVTFCCCSNRSPTRPPPAWSAAYCTSASLAPCSLMLVPYPLCVRWLCQALQRTQALCAAAGSCQHRPRLCAALRSSL